jgi:predicted HTH domain antitoxin
VDKYADAEEIIKLQVYEALEELKNEGIPRQYRKNFRDGESNMATTTEPENI